MRASACRKIGWSGWTVIPSASLLARLRVTRETHEGHRLAKPGGQISRLERDHLTIVRERFLELVRAAQRVGQSELRGDEGRVCRHGRLELLDGFLLATTPFEKVRQPEVRLREVRVETKRLLVLLECSTCIAHTLERRAEVGTHARVAWIRVHREAEVLHRLGPVPSRRRIEATFAVDLRRLHDPVQRRQQRVRDRDLGHRPTARGIDSLLEVLCGLLELA